jgi:predicted ester cyclase
MSTEENKALVRRLMEETAWEELGAGAARITIEDQIAEGDKVATRFTVRMTHLATGVLVTLTAIAIAQLLDGQLVAYWDEADMLGLLRQVGALPAPGPPSERLGWG